MEPSHAISRACLAGALALALAGCGTAFGGLNNAVPAGGTGPMPDARGVVVQNGAPVAMAREGDTLGDIAARVGGTSPGALAELNGLPGDHRFRAGEMVALPEGAAQGGFAGGFDGGFAGGPAVAQGTGWTPEIATTAIDSAPGPVAGVGPADTPFGQGQADIAIDPVRHRVEPGETAYSIARLYGVSVTALASWNGLGPDLAVRPQQELLIPVMGDANRIQTATASQPGQVTAIAPPPTASQPLPQNIETAAVPASPDLGQFRTPPGGRLARPVSGPIVRDFNPGGGGGGRSDGVVFQVPAGTPVGAAGDGEVALVSEALGGMGTIVLIRHRDDLMTVYGRVGNVTVVRGERVSQGQPIGSVAAGDEPGLHFEVRRGTEAVDPSPYIGS